MSNPWENLLDQSGVDSTEPEKSPKKTNRKKAESTEPTVESKPEPEQNISTEKEQLQPNQPLDMDVLIAILGDLQGRYGVDPLIALLTKCDADKIPKKLVIKRGPAANAIITVARELKKRGYL